jgi:small subunit ribosomal protein S2
LLIEREITRLQTRLSGARIMKRRPDLLFIIDVGREDAAVREANLLKIPIVALVDTNCNPLNVDYVIPSNDDAIRAIKLLVAKIADAVLEGKAMRKEDESEQPVAADVKSDGKPKSRGPRKPVVETDQDENIGEDTLLGESTLAKLNVSRKVDDVPAASEAPVAKAEDAPVVSDAPVAKAEDVPVVSDAPVVKVEDDSAEASANAE